MHFPTSIQPKTHVSQHYSTDVCMYDIHGNMVTWREAPLYIRENFKNFVTIMFTIILSKEFDIVCLRSIEPVLLVF
jgi:hypothetical protein